jgi:small subunit ribosomal protein S3
MASEKKFLETSMEEIKIKSYLEKDLSKAGISDIIIQKTPVTTRILLIVKKPGLIVGKKGAGIQQTIETLKKKFNIENPQIEVSEVENPTLDAKLAAEKIARQIEVKGRVKPIMNFALKEIMEAGAIGVEIRVAGKVVGKGAKAKTLAIRKGHLKKSGEELKKVRVGHAEANMKAGIIGVKVSIIPPKTKFLDEEIKITEQGENNVSVAQKPVEGNEQGSPAEQT